MGLINFIMSLSSGQQQASNSDPGANANNTANGLQLFPVIGDSIAMGAALLAGTTPTLGIAKEWNGSNVVDITTDVSSAVNGSPWNDFAIKWHELTGMIPVLVAEGSSGSEFYPHLDNNNWFTSGTLYTPAITKIDSGLVELTTTEPRAILMILSINDARGTQTITDILSGVTSLFDRLTVKYPNSKILIVETGLSGSTVANDRILDCRKLLDNNDAGYVFLTDGIQHGLGAVQRYPNVEMAFTGVKDFYNPDPGLTKFEPDILHPNNKGNLYIGGAMANYLYTL